MARLLNTYQLWLDDLFPKAKFADGLTIIEKVGHTKSMQMRRRGWIEECKPRPAEDDVDAEVEEAINVTNHEDGHDNAPMGQQQPEGGNAMRSPSEDQTAERAASPSMPSRMDVAPDEDELDALLAEDNGSANISTTLFGTGLSKHGQHTGPPDRDTFAEDEEAMAGMMDW